MMLFRRSIHENLVKILKKMTSTSTEKMTGQEDKQAAGRGGKRRERIKLDLLIHDFKVPLAVIEAGITSLFRRPEKYGPLTDKQEKVLVRALRNIKVIQTLVSDALELGRSREGIINRSKVTVSDLIEQSLVEIFDLADGATSEKIKSCTGIGVLRENLEVKGIRLNVTDELWRRQFKLDEAKLKQILRNLLTNALKYKKSLVELGIEQYPESLLFYVQDDGEGIPEFYHKKIFESYFQMDACDTYTVRGHGLGLAGVMVLVEDMDCSLSLESDQGKGAKFIVRIPLSEDTCEIVE